MSGIATLVLLNGQVYTMDPNRPVASAIALRGDEIIAVGSDDMVKSLGGEQIDLGGRCVTPGLVDAHVHFSYYAKGLSQVELMNATSLDEAMALIRARVAELEPGKWVLGRGWTLAIMPNGEFPTAAMLDEISTQHPMIFPDKSGHAAWANSLALRQAGITDSTPDPDGGQIVRDAAGKATGILFETGVHMVRNIVPNPTTAELADMMRVAQQKCWEGGLIGLHDFDDRDCFLALQSLHQNGELGLRMVKNIPQARLDYAIGVGLQSGFGDDWLRIGGIKIFADGALGPRTALMIAPYEGEPNNYGIAVTDKEEMMAISSKASANGLSVTVHAIGDKANHDILDVYEAVRGEEAARGESHSRLRHRIEHVQVLHADDLMRLAQLNVIASMQPIHCVSDMFMAEQNWGDRAKYSYAWRTMLESGAVLAFGSDSPVEPIEPLYGIHAAVTRQRLDGSGGPDGWYGEQKLTMAETIHAFTMGPALTCSQEARQGSLTPGKLADITIYDRNIFEVSHEELKEAQIAGTIVGGKVRYRTW